MANKPESTRPANSWWQRWQRQWRAWRGAGQLKSNRVELVERDGERFKRVIFDTAEAASGCARQLNHLAALDRFPPLRRHHERILEVCFIDGPLAVAGRDAVRLQAFFVDLYAAANRQRVPLPAFGLLDRLATDLDFLCQHRLLSAVKREALWQAAQRQAPGYLWLGCDYIDPVLKNFVVRADQRVIAIDVEALVDGQLLGSGLAKARLRWMQDEPFEILARVEAAGGPDLRPQYRLVELSFLAGYFCQKVVQKKRRHLRLGAFDRWLEDTEPTSQT